MSLSKRNKNLIIVGLLLGGLFAYLGITYVFRPAETIEAQSVDFTGTGAEFSAAVSGDPDAWTGKIVELSGTITNVTAEGFQLADNIFCQVKSGTTTDGLADGQTLRIKGHYIGYDDLLEEIKLDRCIRLE